MKCSKPAIRFASLCIVSLLGVALIAGCSLHSSDSRSFSSKQSKSTASKSSSYARARPGSASTARVAANSKPDQLQEVLDASKSPAAEVVWCAVASGPEGKDIIWIQVRR